MRTFSTYLLLICALALAGAVAGCGGDDDGSGDSGREAEEAEIRAQVTELEDALEAGDEKRFCAVLAPSFVKKLGGPDGCVQSYTEGEGKVLFDADDTDMTVTRVDFEGDTAATAYLANQGFIYMSRQDGKWYPIFPDPTGSVRTG